MILAGRVEVEGRRVEKAGAAVAADSAIRVSGPPHPYVSRGGHKLAAALDVFADRLQAGAARRCPQAWPRARAVLAVAQDLWTRGGAVDAAQALPLYVRDKVAQTTAEREARRVARVAEGQA